MQKFRPTPACWEGRRVGLSRCIVSVRLRLSSQVGAAVNYFLAAGFLAAFLGAAGFFLGEAFGLAALADVFLGAAAFFLGEALGLAALADVFLGAAAFFLGEALGLAAFGLAALAGDFFAVGIRSLLKMTPRTPMSSSSGRRAGRGFRRTGGGVFRPCSSGLSVQAALFVALESRRNRVALLARIVCLPSVATNRVSVLAARGARHQESSRRSMTTIPVCGANRGPLSFAAGNRARRVRCEPCQLSASPGTQVTKLVGSCQSHLEEAYSLCSAAMFKPSRFKR